MQGKLLPTLIVVNPLAPRSAFVARSAHTERKIAARWKEWEPWVLLDLRRRYDGSIPVPTEMARLRRRHRQHVLFLLDAGIEMRLVRRHRLDDPRIADEARRLLVRGTIERRRKRHEAIRVAADVLRRGRAKSQAHVVKE